MWVLMARRFFEYIKFFLVSIFSKKFVAYIKGLKNCKLWEVVHIAKVYKRNIIANILNISDKRVKQLTDEGVFVEVVSGHYSLVESVQAYVKYLQNMISDRDYTSDYNTEKAKLTKAKREKEEAELALRRGELHLASDIEFIMGNMLTSFKAKLLTLPNKALPELKNCKDDTEKLSVLRSIVFEALEELSEYSDELIQEDP